MPERNWKTVAEIAAENGISEDRINDWLMDAPEDIPVVRELGGGLRVEWNDATSESLRRFVSP